MNQSVVKALKLLDFFTEDEPELSLKEIANRSNLPKPTAYRLLSALENQNFLYKIKESNHDSRYRLGLKLLELGQLVSDQLELREIARPLMEELAKEINEAVHLVIINNNQATYIEKVESSRALRLYTRIGKTSPLYIGSGPKLLLAYLPRERQESILSRLDFPIGNTKSVNREQLLQELECIRAKGYSYSEGEQDADTIGISYPIYDHTNEVVAALTVSGLARYFEGDNKKIIIENTAQVAKEISNKMGYQV